MNVLFATLLVISVLLIPSVIIAYVVLETLNKKIEIDNRYVEQPRPESELIGILYSIMEREWLHRVKFHFKLKDIRIPKFEYELDYLVKKIRLSMADGLMNELKYYYTEDAIIIMIKDMCKILILDYMEKHNLQSSTKN